MTSFRGALVQLQASMRPPLRSYRLPPLFQLPASMRSPLSLYRQPPLFPTASMYKLRSSFHLSARSSGLTYKMLGSASPALLPPIQT